MVFVTLEDSTLSTYKTMVHNVIMLLLLYLTSPAIIPTPEEVPTYHKQDLCFKY